MGRPRTLTHSEFLEVALRIVDSEGLEALTFRRLGEEVGVSYTAVYTYFDSRQELLEELAGQLVGDALSTAGSSFDMNRLAALGKTYAGQFLQQPVTRRVRRSQLA